MARTPGFRRRRVLATTAAVIAVVALTGAQKSCQVQTSSSSGKSSASVSVSADTDDMSKSASAVTYSVTSDASIQSVTFINSSGTKVTHTDVGTSWSGSGPSSGRVLVKATMGNGTWIRCSVKAGNAIIQRASATGGGSLTVVCDSTF